MSLVSMIPILSALVAATAADVDLSSLKTIPAKFETIPREYRLDGVVEATNRTTVSAQTQGQVQEILYDVNDFVEKGAVVARLKDTEQRSRVAKAEADVESATATLDQAREEFDRIKGLYKKRAVSDSDMDKAVADVKSAKARLDATTAGLTQAKEQLDHTLVRAPYSGLVIQRHLEVGEIASPGQPVMSGISLEQLRVLVDVPQSVIPAVRKGEGVRIYLPDGTVVDARKVTVFPFADLGSNTFKVRLDLPDGIKQIFPGMFVKTAFTTGEKRELVIPRSAVVYRSEVTGVYVVSDERIRFRQVRLGRVQGDDVVVLAGLDEGERVALDPIAAGVVLKAQTAEKENGDG